MEHEVVKGLAATARTKADLLRVGRGPYFVSAMLAGAYVGFGIMLIFAIGAPLHAAGSAATTLVMGASFGVALSLVVFAGSELFTGNNLVMTLGLVERKVTPGELGAVWGVSFVGNLAGSLLLAVVLGRTGLLAKPALRDFVQEVAAAKMAAPLDELFARAVLCNVLVCLAVWMGARAKEETARLVLIFWCLFAFIGSGFEHSVANMTLFAMSLVAPSGIHPVSWWGFGRNLLVVTAGNMVGGALLVALPYAHLSRGRARVREATRSLPPPGDARAVPVVRTGVASP